MNLRSDEIEHCLLYFSIVLHIVFGLGELFYFICLAFKVVEVLGILLNQVLNRVERLCFDLKRVVDF